MRFKQVLVVVELTAPKRQQRKKEERKEGRKEVDWKGKKRMKKKLEEIERVDSNSSKQILIKFKKVQ